ncbi:TROVE domain-containing protein [Pseudomonas putida]|uniref:TROVE domain-containing protein n=1 Tax=Pseudomonas putida TaxID=303 RepID=A0A8I1EBY2_PSEPU|nr:TROVE domain-containing protein [Pseudomonas putida]MBI6882701.1 TROVE domain-containing protein [Pseudomonas putida]
MANKMVFGSAPQVRNHAGGKSHRKSSEEILACLASTGTFNDTFYASGRDQLDLIHEHAQHVDDEFLAKLALYSRHSAFMKDMPALFCAMLIARQSQYAEHVFESVIDNARMLRNFVQMIRSGAVGRKSLGSRAKRLVKNFIGNMGDYALWQASIGNDPSLVDVIKLAHPKAKDERRNALYGYIMGRPVDVALLPDFIQQYEAFVNGNSREAPLNAPFQKLTGLPLTTKEWTQIAVNSKWQMARMNLNTFNRHGVFEDPAMVRLIADRLQDRENIISARAFPYQLMTAALNVNEDIPHQIRGALEKAMEISLENTPEIQGRTLVAVDVSGSMGSPVTGRQQTKSSNVTCLDAAALIGAAIRRKNKDAMILTFDYTARELKVHRDAEVMTIATKIKQKLGGGTNCGSVVQYLLDNNIGVENLIMVSDNESWADGWNSKLSELWARYKKLHPKARMINCDITPNEYSETSNRADTLRVAGFSDEVFNVMASFLGGGSNQVDAIKKVEIFGKKDVDEVE